MNRYRWFFKKPKNILLHTGRGCDNACGFCAIPAYFGSFRAVSGRRLFDEVKTLVEDYGIRAVWFVDDNFLCNPGRIRELVDLMLEARLPITWFFQTRAELIVDNKELVRDAREAGARLVLIGAESASQEDLDRINKDQDVSTVLEAVRFMHEIGISVWASYTFASEDFATSLPETLRFAKCLNTAIASFAPLTAYPGTTGWERTKPSPSSYRYLDMYTVPRARGDKFGRAVDKAVFRAHLTYGARPSYWRRYLFSREPIIRKVTRRIVFGGFFAIAARRLRYLLARKEN
jgi:radical SAM superfamily enzyme YgiQ (UPF0313 family)